MLRSITRRVLRFRGQGNNNDAGFGWFAMLSEKDSSLSWFAVLSEKELSLSCFMILSCCVFVCRDIMSAPVRRIDEILALPYSEDDFKGQEVPASDNDSWRYDGEDELNSVLQEREKEMEFYSAKKRRKQKGKEKQEAGSSSDANMNNFDLGDISKSIQQFINKVSSYEGAEAPENRLNVSSIYHLS